MAQDDKQLETELELKRRFAELWAKDPAHPLQAALTLMPGQENFAYAAEMASTFPFDEDVQRFRREIIEEAGGELGLLPSKAEFARKAWDYATKQGFPSQDRFKFLQLFGETMGYVGKNAGQGGGTTNNVMIVQGFGSDDEWEQALEEQQNNLIQGEYEQKG